MNSPGVSDTNVGERMLQEAMGRVPPPANPLVRYLVVKEEVLNLEKSGMIGTLPPPYLLPYLYSCSTRRCGWLQAVTLRNGIYDIC